jgi:hypothetical protein
MKFAGNKTKAIAIALFLVLTIAVTLVALPVANAHYPAWTYNTWCYINLSPNPIGVNQNVLAIFWINAYPPTSAGAYGDRWTFTVSVTRPDGSNETLGPFTSDPIGSTYTNYLPTQVGTYIFVAHMATHVITGLPMNPTLTVSQQQGAASVNDTYLGSDSDPFYLTVQQEPIQPWPEAPLPSQFWTRPINSANRNWASIAGNWLAGAAQNVGPTIDFAYGEGPESAHVMWAKPFWSGGVMDARFGDYSYASQNYEPLSLTPPIILDGKLYYRVMENPREGWYCVDLYTGETEYFFNTTGPATGASQSSFGSIREQSLAFGQLLKMENPNQHGGFPYLWSTTAATPNTWMMYDAFTGNYICSIANVSSGGTAVYGKDGSILRYSIVNKGTTANPNYYLTVWNTTQAIWWKPTFTSNFYWYWRPGLNVTYDGNNGFSLNESIPAVQGTIRAVREDQYIIGGTAGSNNENGIVLGNLWCLNLKPDSDGYITPTLLWNKTFIPPSSAGNLTVSLGQVDPEDGVFIFHAQQTRKHYVYSLDTMQQLWESPSESQLNFYLILASTQTCIYQGKLFSYNFGGVILAYDITTGEILWNFTAKGIGFESPYGNYPLYLGCIADGKLYMYSSEHSPTVPQWRGSYVRCINASNGAELWKILDWEASSSPALGGAIGNTAIGDGYLLSLNTYDNRIYCFGKGPSSTTVETPTLAITAGSNAIIRGTVTDQCAGAKEIAEKLGFANGVPAVSDESQEAWMEWLYEQQGKPTNATGVEVSLDAIDPNGNFVHIGTTTSDTNGLFSYQWTPPDVPGKYTITATFAGSAAYYGSYAETAATVSAALSPTAAPEYPQPIDNTLTIVGVGIAIIIAVVLVGIWIKRK